MRQMIGYMLTWTTYGSWLQGDKRGYVTESTVYNENEPLKCHNRKEMHGNPVYLAQRERHIVQNAITNEASNLNKKLLALAVCSEHVHVVLDWDMQDIGAIAGKLKRAATVALRESGVEGKVWTKGYDVQYCYDPGSLRRRIEYVERHN